MWIRDEVRKLNPYFTGKSFNEAELAKYLPDIAVEGTPDIVTGNDDTTQQESLEPRPRKSELVSTPVQAKPVSPARDGDSSTGFGDGDEGGERGDGSSTNGRRKKPTGGSGTELVPLSLRLRSFSVSPGKYELVLRSDRAFSGSVRLDAVGEDGALAQLVPLEVHHTDQGNNPVTIEGGVLLGIALEEDHPLVLRLKMPGTERRSLVARFVR